VISDPNFKVTTFLKSNIGKVTTTHEKNIPNIWNGTMFGDLD